MEKKPGFYLILSGLTLLVLALVFFCFASEAIVTSLITSLMALDNKNTIKKWQKVHLETKLYIFNVTNPDDVLQGALPDFKEVGPYVYNVVREKTDMLIDTANDRITYRLKNTYTFNSAKSSPRKESDLVTVLNIPLLSLAEGVEEEMPSVLVLVNRILQTMFPGEGALFPTVTVGGLFFSGLDIPCPHSSPICTAIKARRSPFLLPNAGGFSYAVMRHENTTKPQVIGVSMGQNNRRKTAEVVSYDNSSKVRGWGNNSPCAQFHGTDSTYFHSFFGPNDPLYIFEPVICRSLKAEFKGWETVKGLRVMYWVGDSVNVRKDGGEAGAGCRCSPGRKAQCLLPGIIDGFSCQGSPVLFSLPHFLDGDPKYLEYARGLSPDQKLHQTFLYLEPLTGAPLEGRKRVQMNFQLRPVPEIDILTNVTQGVFPVFWAEEGAELPEAYFEELKSLLMLVKVINSLGWVLLGIGLLLIAGGITFEVKSRRLLCFNKPSASIQEKSRETMGVQTISGVLYPNSRANPLTHVSTSQVS